MNVVNSESIRVYGGNTGDVSPAQPNTQATTEVLAAGTVYRRRIKGPKANGHFSLHVIVDAAGGASSAMTVWYSNLPDPSVASDADWVQDATVGTIDLTALGGVMKNVGNVDAEWIMVKAAPLTTNASLRAFARVEGVNHGRMG